MGSQITHGRVAVVTGATSGIGIDITRDLLAAGYKVALVGRRACVGEEVAASLNSPNARFFQADVASYDSQAAMFSAVHSLWGRIDVLCANAGIIDKSSIYQLTERSRSAQDVPPAPDLETTDVCYKGVVYGTMLAVHFMRHNSPTAGAKIIVTGSVGALFPNKGLPEYCGSKAAVVQFVRGVAQILKDKDNMTINVVHPGLVDTPIVPPELIKITPEEWRAACISSSTALLLTPVETVLKGYRTFLNDDTGVTGKQLEASGTNLVYYDLLTEANGIATHRAVTVWEPWFVLSHGEKSELPDSVE